MLAVGAKNLNLLGFWMVERVWFMVPVLSWEGVVEICKTRLQKPLNQWNQLTDGGRRFFSLSGPIYWGGGGDHQRKRGREERVRE